MHHRWKNNFFDHHDQEEFIKITISNLAVRQEILVFTTFRYPFFLENQKYFLKGRFHSIESDPQKVKE